MRETVGIIGVGHLAGYLVEGLRRGSEALEIVLSPRNGERSRALAERFGASRASDNAEVVSLSSLVILATRPEHALEAIRGLPWRQGQVLVSVAAGVSRAASTRVSAPAEVVRAMPVSCAAVGESPTSIYPEHGRVRALFARLGTVVDLPDESSFEAASVVGAVYAWVYSLLHEVVDWATGEGVPAGVARELMTRAVRGAAGMVLAHPHEAIADMARRLATRGGLTELGLQTLTDAEAIGVWRRACDAVLERIRNTRS